MRGMMPNDKSCILLHAEMHRPFGSLRRAAMVEIYCETIRDLLNVAPGAKRSCLRAAKVRSRDEKTGSISLTCVLKV